MTVSAASGHDPGRADDLLDELPDGVALIDRDWTLTWINAFAAELLQRPRGSLVGRSLWDVFPEAVGSPLWENCRRVMREGSRVSLDTFDAGRHRWYAVALAPYSDGLLATFRDVTARRRAELLLAGTSGVLTRITEGAALADVLAEIVRMVERQSVDGALASILLLDDDGRHLRHGAAPSLPAFYNEAVDGLPIGPDAGSCGTAAFRREQVFVEDIATDPLWVRWRELARGAGLAACWSTPVLSAEHGLLGTFAIYYREPRAAGEEDLRLIDQVTRTAVVALEHDRTQAGLRAALASAKRATQQSRRLQRLSARLSSALTPMQVAEIAAEQAMRAVGGDGAWVTISDPEALSSLLPDTEAVQGELTLRFGRLRTGSGRQATASEAIPPAVRADALWLPSRHRVRAAAPDLVREHPEVGSLGVFALVADGDRIGRLGVCRVEEGELSAGDRGQLRAVAAQCGRALRRTHHLVSTQQVAEALQQSLLTEPAHVPGFAIEAGYRSALSSVEVGGDWYDAFRLPDGPLALVVGDVQGHDLPAAARMGQLRSKLRAIACDVPAAPQQVLTRLDRLGAHLGYDRFTTMIYASVEPGPDGYRLDWANAGHLPPVLLHPDGRYEILQQPVDPPLNIGEIPVRRGGSARLPVGATVLLYTDGLVESRDTDLHEQITELARRLAPVAGAPLPELRDTALAFAEDPTDDIALVLARATGA